MMKYLKVSIFCLLVLAVHAEDKKKSRKDDFDLSDNEDDASSSSEKRWIQDNQAYQPTISKHYSGLESEGKGQERAKDEKTFKDFIGYDTIQSILLNALRPKPIVDTADESEKLAPNDGSTAQVLGDFVVKGTETISRALNSVIDGPRKAIHKLSAGATQALNQLGAYLVGL